MSRRPQSRDGLQGARPSGSCAFAFMHRIRTIKSMKTFSIKEAFGEGWRWWKQHKKVITIATIIMLAVSSISDGKEGSGFSIIAFIFFIASLFIDMGYWKILLKTAHGEMPKVRDLIDHTRFIWKYLGVSILMFLIVGVGLILLIIPGVYFALKYSFSLVIMLDKDTSIKEAFKESARITEGVKWKLLALVGVIILANLVGVLALVVGLVVSIPVSALAFIAVYKKLSKPEAEVVPIQA